MKTKIFNYLKETDIWLLLLCLAASGYGIFVLFSICNVFDHFSYSLVMVQGGAVLIGLAVSLVISSVDYRTIAQFWKFYAPLAVVLVILTFFIGLKREGADDRAWLPLIGGLTFQPSELLKIAFIMTFALHLEHVRADINRVPTLLLLLLHGSLPILLIHWQGDDGTALVFAVIFLFMLFAAGLSWKYVVAGLLASPLVGAILWFFVLGDHQRSRIELVFFPEKDPLGDGYQALQGKISLGSGMIWGRGPFSDELRSVPAMQNDFIFAYIGQILGFVGCLVVVGLMLAISIKILLVARRSKDLLGYLICVGVFSIFMFQAVVNLGMSLSLTPVIGITLPFFSSGGSSVVISFISIGLVLSVYRHNKVSMFDD